MHRGAGPERRGGFWDDTPIVGLLALPVLIALGRFADQPTRTAGMAGVGAVLVAMLIRGYRNGFEPPRTKSDDEDRADEHGD